MGYFRDLRLIPIALIASACLLVLKTADFALDRGYWLAGDDTPSDGGGSIIRTTPDVVQNSGSGNSWARQMFNFPDGSGRAPTPARAKPPADKGNADITGSVDTMPASRDGKGEAAAAPGKDAKDAKEAKDGKDAKGAKDGKDAKDTKPPSGTLISIDGAPLPSGAERALLERLQERRQELDTRARELDIRESLVNAAEKRIEAHLAELKDAEGRITAQTQKKEDAEATRFKGLVTMYETMKPRDAAKIFDRLDIGVLIEVASKINPRQMAEILAQMSPDTAERLTVELASRAQQVAKGGPAELPKIEGRPTAR